MPSVPEGFPRVKGETRPWVCMKEAPACTRTEPCRSCRGARVRREGLRKQRQAKKLLGVPANRFHGQDGAEENWRGSFAHEVKSQGFAKPVATKFLLMEAQAKGNEAIGNRKPFLATFMPAGWGADGIVAMRLTEWNRHIVPLLDEHGGTAA